MSAQDDGQADETARGGTLRRLPDPPSLVRAREAALRRTHAEPQPALPGEPAEQTRAAAGGGRPVAEDVPAVAESGRAADEDRASVPEPEPEPAGRAAAPEGRPLPPEAPVGVQDAPAVAEEGVAADEGRVGDDEGGCSATSFGGTAAGRLNDFEPGLVASRPPGGAPTPGRETASPQPGTPGSDIDESPEATLALPVNPDVGPAAHAADGDVAGGADAPRPAGGVDHGRAPTGTSGTEDSAADEPTALLPVFVDGGAPEGSPGPAAAADQAPASVPPQPAAPPGAPAAPQPPTAPHAPTAPGAPGTVAGQQPAAPPATVGDPASAVATPGVSAPDPGRAGSGRQPVASPHTAGAAASPGPQTAPPPYSGGPYAPQHGQPQPPPYQQQQQQHHQQQQQHQQPSQQRHPHPAGQQAAHPQAVSYRAVPTRVSVPVVGPELAGTEGKVRHGDTFARRTGRYLKRLLASSADTAAVAAAVRSIQQPLASGRQIAVTSIRGGSGKSTVAALLALTFAHHRTDPVIAVEADPALGTLPRRLGATEVRWSCADLARILDPSMQITDLIGYLLPFSGGGWLLPGSQGTVGTQLDLDTYRIVMTSMRRYFAASVIDCQTLPAEVARTALTTTQARVLVAPATVEGVAATRTVLEWLGKLHHSMLPTTVVALTRTTPDSTLDLRRSTELLQQGGAYVVTLPYDRHLAGGGAIVKDLLALETQEAATRLGGAVMDRAASR